METIEVPIMGETRREQWHGVVHILRAAGQMMEPGAFRDVLAELDRYIDAVEDRLEAEEAEQAGLGDDDGIREAGEDFYREQQEAAYERMREEMER